MGARLCCVVFVLWCSAATTGGADAQSTLRYQGRPLHAVLRELHAEGLRILFASSLVTPGQLVKAEPRARAPREIALEILTPHGLTLKEGPGKTWLVVRAVPDPKTVPAAPPRSSSPGEPAPASDAGVLLRTEEHVDVVEKALEQPPIPSAYTLGSRKVLETPGASENVLQTLATLPGVAATDDESGRLAIRGGGPEHNVILFDGIQVHSPQRFGDFAASFVNPATTAGVALDASGLDARHGGRLSSVTILETRDGVADRAFAFSGSAGLTSGDVLAEGRLPGTKSGSWWGTARGTYYKYVSERFRDSMMPGFGDLQFKVTTYPSARTKLTLLGLAGEETMRRVNSDLDEAPRSADRQFDAANRLAAANLWWTAAPRLRMHTTLSLYSNDARYVDNRLGIVAPFDRRLRVTDVAARHRIAVSWSPRHVLDTGVEVRTLRSLWAMRGATFGPDSRALSPDTWGKGVEYDGPIDSRISRKHASGWIQQRMPLGLGLEAEPGVRVDWNSFTGETAVQPRLRLMRVFGGATLWTGLSWQAQTPGHETMQQGLQYYDLTGPHASHLRNERSRQIVAGLELPVGAAAVLRIEAYRRAFDHLLVQRLETDEQRAARLSRYAIPDDMPPDSALLEFRPTIRPDSVGTGTATGVEVLVQRDQGRLTGWVGYTLGRSERDLYGRTVASDFDRRHALSIVANLQIRSKLRVGVSAQVASGTPLTPLVPEVVFSQYPLPGAPDGRLTPARATGGVLLRLNDRNQLRVSALNSSRMPIYARTDVRVTYAIASWLEVYGEVINLLNRENFHPHAIFGNRPGQYEVAPTMPRLPSYGVRVRF